MKTSVLFGWFHRIAFRAAMTNRSARKLYRGEGSNTPQKPQTRFPTTAFPARITTGSSRLRLRENQSAQGRVLRSFGAAMFVRRWLFALIIMGVVASSLPAQRPPRIGDPTRDIHHTLQARKLLADEPEL